MRKMNVREWYSAASETVREILVWSDDDDADDRDGVGFSGRTFMYSLTPAQSGKPGMRSWQKSTKAWFAAPTTGVVGQSVSSRSKVMTSTVEDDDAEGEARRARATRGPGRVAREGAASARRSRTRAAFARRVPGGTRAGAASATMGVARATADSARAPRRARRERDDPPTICHVDPSG